MHRSRSIPLAALVLVLGAVSARGQTHAASSSQRDDLAPAFAFDGLRATRWSAAFDRRTGWIEVAFPEARTFDRVTVLNGVRELKGAPAAYTVLAGEPGASRALTSVSGLKTDGVTTAFERTTARVWRIEVAALIDARWSPTISEITWSLGDDAVGAAPAVAEDVPVVTATHRSAGGRGPEAVVDGDPRTYWQSAEKGEVGIELRWDQARTFDALELRVPARGGRGVAKALRLRALKGGLWTSVAELEDSYRNRIRLRFPSTTAKAWKLEIVDLVDPGSEARVGELELRLLADRDWPPVPPAKTHPREVNAAIDRGVAWLLERREKDGSWSSSSKSEFPMGVMALGGLALRKSGLERDDPVLLDLVARVETMPLAKTYGVALKAMFLRAMSGKLYNDRIAACADWLAEEQAPDGLWGYPTGRSDLSNAQYALLAFKCAHEIGHRVERKAIERSWDWLLRGARPDGGFNYVPHGDAARDPATGSMTVAALASLAICAELLPRDGGRGAKSEKVATAAFAWIDRHFVVEMNPRSPQSHFYWLYGVERVGAFYARRELAGLDWYQEGAAFLLEQQERDSSWHGDFVDTCFALLFLRRASLTGSGD